MNTTNYTVFTDSACDIPRETLEKWGVKYVCLSFAFDGDAKQYGNYDLTAHDFYQRMRGCQDLGGERRRLQGLLC